MPKLNPDLAAVLLAAYQPCPAFAGPCASMRWDPPQGHVPRGFCGAAGRLDNVQLILVCAEPGDPHATECHDAGTTPESRLESAYAYAFECFRSGKDLFHRNIRQILSFCWPNDDFERQLERTWIVDSVLCSARIEGGRIPAVAARECRRRYFELQRALLPEALIVALGGKAQARLTGVPGVIQAFAAAPPGCNRLAARTSWLRAAQLVREGTRQNEQ